MIKNEYVNENGLKEIRNFLKEYHKQGENFTDSMINAWAAEAEASLGQGNPPMIEIPSFDSVTGHTELFTVSEAGLSVDEDLEGEE